MPLYIKDPEVATLAADAAKILGVTSKTEAVRVALQSAIAHAKANAVAKDEVPLAEFIKKAQDMIDAVGPRDPNYDHKRDMDELWGV